jgi:MFS family permease
VRAEADDPGAAAGGATDAEAASSRNTLLAPLRIPVFRAIWTAFVVSNLGGVIQGVGAAWLMTTLTDSPATVALVQASNTLPIMLFSLAAGALADTTDRRMLMLTAQTTMLVIAAVLALLAWLGMISPLLLLALTFAMSSFAAFNGPAWEATIGDLVPRETLPQAVLLNSIGFNVTRSVGPAIGGAIVAAAGAATAFAVNAVSYIGLILVLLRSPSLTWTSQLPREPIVRALSVGLRFVFMSPSIRSVLPRAALFGLTAITIQALLPLVARDMLGGGAVLYGVLVGIFGAGAVLGAVVAVRLRARIGDEWTVRVAFLAQAAAAMLIALGSSIWAALLAMLLGGIAWVSALTLFNVTVQFATPRWVVARALSTYHTVTFGCMAAGSWLWGRVAEGSDISTALLTSGAVSMVGALLGLLLPMPARSQENLTPVNRWQEPRLTLEIEHRSGPIVITVDFVVPEANRAAFLVAMGERRRIRTRNGAHQWTLLRDLAEPDRWTESYHVANWTEYIRHNQRTTHADAAISERLLALHRADAPPKVTRRIVRPPWHL